MGFFGNKVNTDFITRRLTGKGQPGDIAEEGGQLNVKYDMIRIEKDHNFVNNPTATVTYLLRSEVLATMGPFPFTSGGVVSLQELEGIFHLSWEKQ